MGVYKTGNTRYRAENNKLILQVEEEVFTPAYPVSSSKYFWRDACIEDLTEDYKIQNNEKTQIIFKSKQMLTRDQFNALKEQIDKCWNKDVPRPILVEGDIEIVKISV